jgi:hypothetical protein
MAEYLAMYKADGTVFDPWVRLHLALGAQQLHVCERAMSIQMPWEEWIQYGSGLYVEPNVWMVHL